jgi:diadenosine tetraphosphate (Ap4A) HIT family hydrolase
MLDFVGKKEYKALNRCCGSRLKRKTLLGYQRAVKFTMGVLSLPKITLEVGHVKTCCLCSNLASNQPRRSWDEPLFESANFIAMPSLGSIVEGWMLIVPRNHFVSMGALSPKLSKEMEGLKSRVTTYLTSMYGDLCAFEHGPRSVGRQVGCGVDHAHLHVVPVNFDLITASTPYLPPDVQWKDGDIGDCRAVFERGYDYLYVEQPLGRGRIAVHDKFGSQIFRKAIAAAAGFTDQFNWRDHPNFENIARTIEACRGAASL